MRPPPSLHSNFFSSLKQVEKRLKSEQESKESQPPDAGKSFPQSLSSPIHIHSDQLSDIEENPSTFTEPSEPPRAFLSCSPQFQPTDENPVQRNIPNRQKPLSEPDSVDDIEQLIQLLGLSESKKSDEIEVESSDLCGSCHCEGGFRSKIVGVKGPKCGKEVERLEGWIQYFISSDENEIKIEPLRLSLLLLGKAAFVSQGEDSGFGGLDFPSAIEDFLINDPPLTNFTAYAHLL